MGKKGDGANIRDVKTTTQVSINPDTRQLLQLQFLWAVKEKCFFLVIFVWQLKQHFH